MIFNNVNPYANTNLFSAGYNASGMNSGVSYVPAAVTSLPQTGSLWGMPVQNFRVDGGNTNLYSQQVVIDWPQFRPQTPIFSGPRISQDTGNIYSSPGSNFNFDNGGYSNFSGRIAGGGLQLWPELNCRPNSSYWPNPWDNCQPNNHYRPIIWENCQPSIPVWPVINPWPNPWENCQPTAVIVEIYQPNISYWPCPGDFYPPIVPFGGTAAW